MSGNGLGNQGNNREINVPYLISIKIVKSGFLLPLGSFYTVNVTCKYQSFTCSHIIAQV